MGTTRIAGVDVSVELLGLLLAGVLAGTPLWAATRFLVTVIHEAGHAAITLVTPGRVQYVLVRTDSSGVTHSVSDDDGSPGALFLLAGHPAPALLGLAGIYAASRGWSTQALVGGLVTVGFVLLLIRNLVGLAVVLTIGAGFGAFLWYAPPGARPLFVVTAGWVLLLGAIRMAVEQFLGGPCADPERHGRFDDTPCAECQPADALSLQNLMDVPRVMWCALFLTVNVGLAVLAGWLVLAA